MKLSVCCIRTKRRKEESEKMKRKIQEGKRKKTKIRKNVAILAL